MSSSKPRICSFESRRGTEIGALIERYGGEPTVVASMQEVPLDDNEAVIEFANQLESGAVDYVVFMTGVGAKAVKAVLDGQSRFENFNSALSRTQIILRGPKPKAVLHKWGLRDFHEVAEPNTWRELLMLVEEKQFELTGKVVAVQEYGVPSTELYDELQRRGATVLRVPVYQWKLPDETAPLADAIQQAIGGSFDAIMFTSANQLRNVLQVAAEAGVKDEFIQATQRCLVASVGPTCSEAIVTEGLRVGFEASPPKMSPLVRGTIEALGTTTQT